MSDKLIVVTGAGGFIERQYADSECLRWKPNIPLRLGLEKAYA